MVTRQTLSLGVLTSLLLALVGLVFAAPVHATPASSVELTIDADKDAYDQGETATFTMTAHNVSDSEVTDVAYTVALPEEMELIEGSQASGSVASLAAGETYTATVQAKVLAPASADATASIPQTGDNAFALIAACVGGALLLGGAGYVTHRRNGGGTMVLVAVLTIAGLLCAAAPHVAYAADAARETVEASCDITAAGQKRTVKVSASYAVPGDASEEPGEPSGEATTMTRAEWVSRLLDGTGAIDLETNEEPYADIAGHAAEADIKTAWVLNVLPDDGRDFDPDAVATRDFVYAVAALAADVDADGKELTTPDAAEAEHPKLLAAAIEAGLLATDDEGCANPASPFDAREAKALIEQIVTLGTREDDGSDVAADGSSYEYRRDVLVINGYSEQRDVYVVDNQQDIAVGDKVALEPSDGSIGGVIGTVAQISPAGDKAFLHIDPATDPSEIYSSISLNEQNLAISASDMVLAEGVTFADVPNVQNARNRVDLDPKVNLNITYPKEGNDDVKVSGSLSIQPYVNVEWKWISLFKGPRRIDLGFGSDTTVTGSVDASVDKNISVPILDGTDIQTHVPGILVGVNLDLAVSAEGHITFTATINSEAGITYNRVAGFEPYGSLDSDTKLELNAGFRAGLSPWLSLNCGIKEFNAPLIDGSFEAGVDGSGSAIVRDTGLICNDTSLYAYARVALGEHSEIFKWVTDALDWTLAHDLWDESSSPFSIKMHWEDGELVDACTYHEGGSSDEGGTGVVDPNFDGIPAPEDEGWGHEPAWTVSDNNHEEIVDPFYIDAGSSITVTAQEGCNYRGMFGSSGNSLVRRSVSFDNGEVITYLDQGVYMFPWDSSDVSTVTLEVLVGRLKVWDLEGWGTDPLSGETFAARPVYSLRDCHVVAYPVSLSATVVTVGVGDSYQLEAQQSVQSIYESEGCDYRDGTEWSWESDNGRIASVDDNGRITGVAPGTTYVTVTYGNGTMGFDRICKVVVTE